MIVTLDVSADEYYGSEQVKRALVRYPIKVVRLDIDPERNLWPGAGLLRQRAPAHRNAADADPGRRAQTPPATCRRLPMKPVALSALAGVLLILGVVPASQAVEILRWERLPLPVPLVVGQERVVFIDRNVRVGVPASVGDHLRVQSAGGAIYLRASEPIPPTRLQLQDVESGALILLDIAAEPAKDGQAPLEPVRIVKRRPREALRRRCSKWRGRAGRCARRQIRSPARNAGIGRVDAPCRTEPVRAAAPSSRSPASGA